MQQSNAPDVVTNMNMIIRSEPCGGNNNIILKSIFYDFLDVFNTHESLSVCKMCIWCRHLNPKPVIHSITNTMQLFIPTI